MEDIGLTTGCGKYDPTKFHEVIRLPKKPKLVVDVEDDIVNLKSCAKKVFALKEQYAELDKFAREVLHSIWRNEPKQRDTWRGYKDFELISDKEMKINFTYGAGEMEFDGYYTVEFDKNGYKIFEE